MQAFEVFSAVGGVEAVADANAVQADDRGALLYIDVWAAGAGEHAPRALAELARTLVVLVRGITFGFDHFVKTSAGVVAHPSR